jgi:hypothetical protein
MHRPWGRSRSYHEWPSSTPVIDAVRTIVAFASLVIGAYAALFLAFAVMDGDREAAAQNVLFFVAIGLANGLMDGLRHWRRHHG